MHHKQCWQSLQCSATSLDGFQWQRFTAGREQDGRGEMGGRGGTSKGMKKEKEEGRFGE